MTYNTKTIRNALSAARGVSLELMHDALAALAEIERERAELDRKLNNYILIGEAYSRRAVKAEAERDALRAYSADIAELDARIADYRDEFSGLCHTLSVGSEGRPEMTASDWRKRVDQGIDFLTRPLLARIEATDKELAKRSSMLDICTQNCSDWIGKWRAEQERAERAEAELARLREQEPVAAEDAIFAWLVERADGKYLHVSDAGILDWCDDHMSAIRLSRRRDADALAGICELDDCRAVEHGWHDLQAKEAP